MQVADSDFDCDSEQDDETTIAAQEKDGSETASSIQKEIEQLKADQNLSVEELRRK